MGFTIFTKMQKGSDRQPSASGSERDAESVVPAGEVP